MRHKLIFTVCCCSVIRSAYKHKYMCDWVCVFGVSVVVVPSSEKRRKSLHFIFGSLIVIQCEKLFLCTSNDFVWNHCRHYVFHVHYVSLPLPNDNAKGQRLWFAWWLHSMIVILWLCRMQTCRHIIATWKSQIEIIVSCGCRSWPNPTKYCMMMTSFSRTFHRT